MGVAAAGVLFRAAELRANPLNLPIGCQTWPVRQSMVKDLNGTLKQLAGYGFQRIELCSPPGYGWAPLAKMKASELKDAIQSAGLECESCHFLFGEMKQHADERIAWAKEMGLKQMIVSTFALKPDATLDDWTSATDQLNKIAEQVKSAGMQQGFHNHQFEFKTIDGVLIYDHIMKTLDPKLVKMQFQMDVISLGYDASTYFHKYPGRFISMHLQDWSPEQKKDVTIGQGIVDWKKEFTAAKTAGVKNIFVELDPEMMKASCDYLHSLKV